LAVLFAVLAGASTHAQKAKIPDNAFWDNNEYDLSVILSEVHELGVPFVRGEYLVFTADTKPRFVGLAFGFEGFSVVHPMKRIDTRDMDDEITRSIYFYALKLTEDMSTVTYKMVADGLWITDPVNPNRRYDYAVGYLSWCDIPQTQQTVTQVMRGKGASNQNQMVRFVFKGEENQYVTLTGTFTAWDPFLYEMTETQPGQYEFYLPLPPGTYQYKFVHGFTEFVDPANDERVFNDDGRSASVIHVR
jgi:hypothetical protein